MKFSEFLASILCAKCRVELTLLLQPALKRGGEEVITAAIKHETLEPVSIWCKSSKIQDIGGRGWESTEEDGANAVLEQFYNGLVKRQRDVLCCKSGVAGPTHNPTEQVCPP